MNRNSGFTLVELAVTLALIATVTSLTVKTLSVRMVREDLKVLRMNVQEVKYAVNAHLLESCNSGTSVTPSLSTLVADGLISSSAQTINPISNQALTISIVWTQPFRYTVVAPFSSAAQANSFLKASGASQVSGSSLVWEGTFNSDEFNTDGNRQFSRMFEGNCN